MTPSVEIRGPIVSTNSLEAHAEFFNGVMGFETAAPEILEGFDSAKLLGLADTVLSTAYLTKPPTEFGIRLWRISPASVDTVRSAQTGTDVDALKVIDIYVPDFEQSVQTLSEAGFQPNSNIARYSLPEGEFTEAHFWRPDNVVCALISGPAAFFADFVSLADQPFSEPQSISAPVSNVAAVLDFYACVFDLHELHRYEFSSPSFDAMVGSDTPLKLSAINVGVSLKQPYLGVIDYGAHRDSLHSLSGRSRPPARGLIGVEVVVDSTHSIVANAERNGFDVLAPPERLTYPPYGEVLTALIEAPHGAVHHVIEPLLTRN